MKQLGVVSFNHGSKIRRILIDRPTVGLRPATHEPRVHAHVSPALEGHLRAWWGGVRAARKLDCTALDPEFDWLGDDPFWPDWVHVGALAQLAGRTFDRGVGSGEMGRWLRQQGVRSIKQIVVRKNHKGRVTYQTTRTFYKMG